MLFVSGCDTAKHTRTVGLVPGYAEGKSVYIINAT